MRHGRVVRQSLLGGAVACAVALGGCGGDGDEPASSSTGGTTTPAASSARSAKGPDLDTVLRCLNAAGVPAKRQSSLGDADDVIGIDGSGGRTVITFSKTQEDADLVASAAGQYGEVVREGLVTASLEDGSGDPAIIRGCMTGTAAVSGSDSGSAPATGSASASMPESQSEAATAAAGTVAADAPGPEEVRSCLRGRGVAVRDKGATKGDGVEIAHTDGSVTVIDFTENEQVAQAVEKASKAYGPVVRVGPVVASLTSAGERFAPDIRACISG